jgi:hypothetical protein
MVPEVVVEAGFEPANVRNEQIYSLRHLATWILHPKEGSQEGIHQGMIKKKLPRWPGVTLLHDIGLHSPQTFHGRAPRLA